MNPYKKENRDRVPALQRISKGGDQRDWTRTMKNKGIITIDGSAGSGKSTLSRLLAKELGWFYLDTGAMYRAVALQSVRQGVAPEDRKALETLCRNLDLSFRMQEGDYHPHLGEEDISGEIRTPRMDLLSSKLSAFQEVREAMTGLQQRLATRGEVVAEGRDMGTVVFPHADFKFFLTADPKVRAERRYRERLGRGEPVRRQEVEEELMERDEQDMTRVLAPLQPASDAVVIDTTLLDPAQVLQAMLKVIRRGGAHRGVDE